MLALVVLVQLLLLAEAPLHIVAVAEEVLMVVLLEQKPLVQAVLVVAEQEFMETM
jgi:hypothetical protein